MAEDSSVSITDITGPDNSLLKYYVIISCLSGPLFPITFLPLFFKFKTLEYEFDGEGVSMSWGILWKTEISVSYSRIQDIHISKGLIERWLGLGTIRIQTASGSAGAEMTIVGLERHEEVRDFLYSKMRGVKFGVGEEAEEKSGPGGEHSPASAVAGSGDGGRGRTEDLLSDIHGELKKLRQHIEESETGNV